MNTAPGFPAMVRAGWPFLIVGGATIDVDGWPMVLTTEVGTPVTWLRTVAEAGTMEGASVDGVLLLEPPVTWTITTTTTATTTTATMAKIMVDALKRDGGLAPGL